MTKNQQLFNKVNEAYNNNRLQSFYVVKENHKKTIICYHVYNSDYHFSIDNNGKFHSYSGYVYIDSEQALKLLR